MAIELGDELDTLIREAGKTTDSPMKGFDWRMKIVVIDTLMGVLARHSGMVIVNDEDLPVTPLPFRERGLHPRP